MDTPESHLDEADPNLLILPMPADLEPGTYTVAWRNISAADGHPAEGLLTFTIGTGQDVQLPAPPETRDFGGPPTYVEAAGRWLGLAGPAGALGALVTGFWLVLPVAGTLPGAVRQRTVAALRRLVIVCVVVALCGSAIALINQTLTVEATFSIGAAGELLVESEFGRLWLVRVAALALLGILIVGSARQHVTADRRFSAGAAMLASAALVPFALNSHATAVSPGRVVAVFADLLHLLAASVWVGGLLALAVTMSVGWRGIDPADRRRALATIVPRFSSLAISSVVILSATGFYASWLQVGNLTALTETDHGRALIIKLLLVSTMIGLGAVNLLVVEPRLRRAAASGHGLRWTVTVEGLLAIGVLLAVGVLTSLPTGRGVLESESGRSVFHISEGDTHVSLYVSPGAVGLNRYTAEFDLAGSEQVPASSEVLLRASTAGVVQGEREVRLEPTGDNRYEASGSELSVVGDWQLELILRRPETSDWRVAASLPVREEAPEERAPGPSPRFVRTSGFAWTLMGIASIPAIVLGWRHGREWIPVGAGVLLLLASAAGMLTTYEMAGGVDGGGNPIPRTPSSISIGRGLFEENCVACHGADAKGTGPALASTDRANADLTASHVDDHRDKQLHWWIRKGIGGTPMPSFESELTDDEIWHLVNYIRSLRP